MHVIKKYTFLVKTNKKNILENLDKFWSELERRTFESQISRRIRKYEAVINVD